MNKQEIIAEIRNMKRFNYTLAPDEVFETAIKAIDKQIPKEPYQACGHSLERWMNFCPMCGQAIYWGKNDAEI